MAFNWAPIEAEVTTAAKELGVDPAFALQIHRQERGQTPDAVSSAGARGPMQVMPATAAELEPRYGTSNVRQGVGYLRDLSEMFQDAPAEQRNFFIAAAYNAGPGRVLDIAEQIKAQGGNASDIASYADFLPDETLNYVAKLAEAMPPQARKLAVQASKPRQPETLGRAVEHSLAAEGERQLEGVRGAGRALAGLVQPTGEATPLDALRASKDAILGTLGSIGQVASPGMTAGGVGGETLARMGLIPLTPEQGALAGSLGVGALTLAPGVIRGGARLLSPTLRGVERAAALRGAAQGEQALARGARATQLGARAEAGAGAKGVAETIGGRLQKEAEDLAKASNAQQPGAYRLQPRAEVPPSGSRTLETTTSPILDARGRPITRTEEVITHSYGRPARTLTEADYSKGFLELRRANERAAQAAVHFDRTVGQRLSRLGPRGASAALAKDADLSSAILAHATPEEAAIIQRAITAGKPLSKLPYTEAELAKIGSDIVQSRSRLLTPLFHFGLGGAGVGYFTGHPQALTYAGLALAGRLGLKALDAAIGSKPSAAALRQLGRLAPGSADSARILAALGGELHGRQLTSQTGPSSPVPTAR